jgi:hypothetical protein
VRRIPALSIPLLGDIFAPPEETAPGYGALSKRFASKNTQDFFAACEQIGW